MNRADEPSEITSNRV